MRFATQLPGAASGDEWRGRARRLESLGYAALLMPDHATGGWSPFPSLVAAGSATTRLRLGTLVLDNDFRHPLLLAREAATVDWLTGGRLELGIGAGWDPRDNEALGTPLDRGRVRVARLAECVSLLKRLLSGEEVTFQGRYYRLTRARCAPPAVQRPHPPLLIAGGGDELLSLAGREADVVAIVPHGLGVRPLPPESMSLDAMRRQVAVVREAAGARWERIELSMFLDVELTDDPDAAIRAAAASLHRDEGALRSSMYRVFGTPGDVSTRIRLLHDELGMSYFCLRGPDVETLAPVVRALAGR